MSQSDVKRHFCDVLRLQNTLFTFPAWQGNGFFRVKVKKSLLTFWLCGLSHGEKSSFWRNVWNLRKMVKKWRFRHFLTTFQLLTHIFVKALKFYTVSSLSSAVLAKSSHLDPKVGDLHRKWPFLDPLGFKRDLLQWSARVVKKNGYFAKKTGKR